MKTQITLNSVVTYKAPKADEIGLTFTVQEIEHESNWCLIRANIDLGAFNPTRTANISDLKLVTQTITKQETCARFGCTMEQLNAQYKANHATLSGMYHKAVKSGKKMNNYTADQLKELTDKYAHLSGK